MANPIFTIIGVATIAIGCWKLRPAYHVYRGDTDDVLDAERADGPVELEGSASPVDGTVTSPLTGTECLAYEYEVTEYRSSGKNSSWRTVDEGSDGVPFRLDDGTASVRVDPEGAEFALSTERRIEVDGGDPEPDAVRSFLATHSDLESESGSMDLGVVEIATGNDRRYHERRLDPEEEAYVLGQSRYDVDARETMRDVSAVIEDGDRTPVFVVADSCQDGAARRLAKPALPWLIVGVFGIVVGLA